MKIALIVGIVMLFITGQIIVNGMLENDPLLEDNTSPLTDMSQITTMQSSNIVGQAWEFVQDIGRFIGGMMRILAWDYGIWDGGMAYVYWMVCIPLTIGLVGGFVMVFRGVSSS